MPYISVIMGVFNAEATVFEAAKSILCGTMRDIELIVVDDASTDKTSEKLQEVLKDPRCLYMKNDKNRGLPYSLNQAIGIATGEYIARMDADDLSLPNRLKIQSDFLNSHPEFGFVGSAAYLTHEGIIYGKRRFKNEPGPNDLTVRNQFIHPTVLFRRSALEAVHGYRETASVYRCEDYDLYFRLYAKKIYGYNLSDCLLLYNEPPNKIKHSFKSRKSEFMTRIRGSFSLKKPLGLVRAVKCLAAPLLPPSVYFKIRNKRKENHPE